MKYVLTVAYHSGDLTAIILHDISFITTQFMHICNKILWSKLLPKLIDKSIYQHYTIKETQIMIKKEKACTILEVTTSTEIFSRCFIKVKEVEISVLIS